MSHSYCYLLLAFSRSGQKLLCLIVVLSRFLDVYNYIQPDNFCWQVTRVAPPSFKRCSARNPEENIEKKFDTFLPDDTNTEVDKEEIIKG